MKKYSMFLKQKLIDRFNKNLIKRVFMWEHDNMILN